MHMHMYAYVPLVYMYRHTTNTYIQIPFFSFILSPLKTLSTDRITYSPII